MGAVAFEEEVTIERVDFGGADLVGWNSSESGPEVIVDPPGVADNGLGRDPHLRSLEPGLEDGSVPALADGAQG